MAKLALLVATLAALAAPAGAGAATRIFSGGNFLQRPALAGERVLVAEQRPDRSTRLLSVPAAGGSPATLLEADRGRLGSALLTYAGSAERAFARRAYEGGPNHVLGGPATGPLTSELESCGDELEFVPGPAVDGEVAAWAGAECAPQRIRIRSGDTSRVVDAGDHVYDVAVGGRFVAWLALERPADPRELSRTRLVVYDTAAGAHAYTALVPPSLELDVQADGTVVLASFTATDLSCPGGSPRARILYYTAAEPVEHELPVRSCESAVRIAGDRVAFVEHLGGSRRMLTLSDLTGSVRRQVARIDMFPPQNTIDWDGRSVAWSQTRCRDYALFVRDASDSSPPQAAVSCPVRVGSYPRLSRDGTIHVRIACPNGCRTLPGQGQGMTVISPSWLHVWSRRGGTTRYAPYVRFSLAPGRSTTLRLPTTRYQRAVIRRRGRVNLRLKVNAQNVYLPRIARTLRAR